MVIFGDDDEEMKICDLILNDVNHETCISFHSVNGKKGGGLGWEALGNWERRMSVLELISSAAAAAGRSLKGTVAMALESWPLGSRVGLPGWGFNQFRIDTIEKHRSRCYSSEEHNLRDDCWRRGRVIVGNGKSTKKRFQFLGSGEWGLGQSSIRF